MTRPKPKPKPAAEVVVLPALNGFGMPPGSVTSECARCGRTLVADQGRLRADAATGRRLRYSCERCATPTPTQPPTPERSNA